LIKFGTDGWRGILAADFTFRNVRAVARAVAGYLKAAEPDKVCLIGYDNRFLAPEMAKVAWTCSRRRMCRRPWSTGLPRRRCWPTR
jgi:phosphomannomutase